MDNEKDLYNTARFKKLNIDLKKEDDIVYERATTSKAPVVRKPRPSYSRHSTFEVEEPSTPHQSRPIEERNFARQAKEKNYRQNIPDYARPNKYPRQNESLYETQRISNNTQRPSFESQRALYETQRINAQLQDDSYEAKRAEYINQRFPVQNKKLDPSEIKMPKNLKKRRRRGSNGFKKFIIIYSAVLLAIVIAASVVLTSFVKNYETKQPSNLAAKIATSLTKDSLAYLDSNKDKITCLENVDAIISKSAELIGKNKVSYIENRDYRAEAPSYDFTVDGNVVAKVIFEPARKDKFGLTTWKIKSLDVAEYIPDTKSYTIYAPEGITLSVNDNPIGDLFKTAEVQIPEHLQQATKFTDVPSYETYKISGFVNAPSVKAIDANGNELGITQTSEKIVVGTTTSQEFIDEVSGMVDDAIENWAKYFVHYGGNLRRYIHSDCDWYKYIFGGDDIYPISPQFYWYENIDSVEFPVKESKNYIRYTDNIFSVDVKYEMTVNFDTDTLHDENQKLDATWIWYHDGEDWYIIDCIYK